MKRVLLFFILNLMINGTSGQYQDTIDLTLPIAFTKTNNSYRRIPTQSFYLELAGHLNVISLNYEKMIIHKERFYITGRIGAGYTPPTINTIGILALVNGLYQVSDVFLLEIGFGVNTTFTFWQDYTSEGVAFSRNTINESGFFVDPLLTCFAGIRFQKKKGFLFRFGFTPLIELTNIIENRTGYRQLETTSSFIPWVGMSFGYSFY